MSLENELEEIGLCRAYVRSQFKEQQRAAADGAHWPAPGPAVAISSQTGAGSRLVARELADILQKIENGAPAAWTVFDRQLVEKVLEEHHLPKDLAKYMPEDRRSFIQDVMDEFLGLRPPSWVLVPKITETVLHLADAGHVILVGRGANFITERMPNVFHVRLVASLPRRIERVQGAKGMTREEAAKYVARTDRGIGRYSKAHFHVRPHDDLLYHLVINTDRVPCRAAAQLIADAARKCLECFRSLGGKQEPGA